MPPVTITRITVVEYPAWNSSYARNLEPKPTPRWTMDDGTADFSGLVAKLSETAQVNGQHTLQAFLSERPVVERRPEEPGPSGAIPAHTDIILSLSDGQRLKVGEHPLYSLGSAFDEVVALVKRVGRHDFLPP